LSGADLTHLSLKDANLAGTDLSDAKLSRTLVNADLQFARLKGAHGLEHIVRSKARNLILAEYSSEILERLPVDKNHHNERLSKKDLSGYRCPGLDFCNANLAGFDLSKAVFTDCRFVHANLSLTNLSETNLGWCTLEAADFTGADLQGAVLTYSNVR